MARPKGRGPQVEVRRHTSKDGVVSEYASVRYVDRDGVRKRLRCRTAAEAELERARIALEGAPAPPRALQGATTLADFWPVWLADARLRLAGNTLEAYEYFWRREIEPRFGALALRDITPRAVAQWRAALVDVGIGEESIRKSMVLLQGIFKVAIEWGEASENPVAVVRKPKRGRRGAVEIIEPRVVEQLRVDMLAADDPFSATLTVLLAYSGMRPGEALGLQRRHVRRDTILIEQAAARGKVKVQKTGRAYRTVDLLGPLSDDLEEWFEERGIISRTDRLFPRRDGGWWTKDDWDNWRERRFHKFTRAIDLGTPRPYDLRHSFASLLIREQRASVVDIADQLGHAPTETLNTYSHVVREFRRQEPVDAATAILDARREIAAMSDSPAPPAGRSMPAHRKGSMRAKARIVEG